jgi:hypothetical protein
LAEAKTRRRLRRQAQIKREQRQEVGAVGEEVLDRSYGNRHEFHESPETRMIRVFSRAFAAEFLICDYLRKSAAEAVLPIASCQLLIAQRRRVES